MKKILSNKRFLRFAGLLVLAGLVFSMTDAGNVPSLVIMLGFILLTGVIYYLIYGIISILGLYGFRVKRQQLIAGYLTGIFAIVIALQSIGEMGKWDFWVLLPLAILAYFYSSLSKAKS